jgi:putative DNA primase/helicase
MKFSELNARLLPSLPSLVSQWLPSGKRQADEWVALNPTRNDKKLGSFRINIHTGKWADFSTNDAGGDPVSLYAYLHGFTQKEAAERLAQNIGVDFTANDNRVPQASRPAVKEAEVPAATCEPVPNTAGMPSTRHFKHGEATAVWQYRDQEGRTLGYICRYDTPDGKEILPLTWVDGRWQWKSFPKPRPLYGLDRLAAAPEATVMVVEGEKAADAAQKLFPQLAVISWAGGAKAVKHAHWDALAGRRIILCPDNDEPGTQAMLDVASVLPRNCNLRWCSPPDDAPQGWDFADADPNQDWKGYVKASLTDVPVPEQPIIENVQNNVQVAPLTAGAVDTYSPLPDMTPRFKPMATIENVNEIVKRLNVNVRYNVISKEEEILIPGESYSVDNKANASFAWLQSWCARFNMPTEKLGDFVTYLADRNQYNPVAQWVQSKPWDGISRIEQFCDTIKAHDEENDERVLFMKRTLIKRWLISAIAAAFQPDGVSAHGVLVLQGDQYVGKTKWFKSLVPEELGLTQDGMMLRPDDKDSVKQAVSFWLVELGELDATFRKSDIAALKAFLTRKNDVLRRAYARKESHFARRTVFFASVNPQQFLHDPTGNRRYWTISARAIDHSHNIDMQQLWAEVLVLFKAGETYFLLPEEMDALNRSNEEFTVIDPILERLQSQLDWNADRSYWEWKSTTDILLSIGFERPSQSDCTKAAGYIRQLNGGASRRSGKGRFVLVPNKASQASW